MDVVTPVFAQVFARCLPRYLKVLWCALCKEPRTKAQAPVEKVISDVAQCRPEHGAVLASWTTPLALR